MAIRRLVTENLGYALLGGPALGIVSYLGGAYLADAAVGIGCGVVVYGLGWVLAVRRSGREGQRSTPDSDGERSRQEKELEIEKGGYGGNSGGG